MTIYDRIRELRISHNMSQDDLARAMGYKDRSMITKIESGKVDISRTKIMEFARILNTTPAYLMGWADELEENIGATAQTSESRIISAGIDRMPKERREQAIRILQAAFAEYSDYFKEDHTDDA